MISGIVRRLKRIAGLSAAPARRLEASGPDAVSQRTLVRHLRTIIHCDKRIEFYNRYVYAEGRGLWLKVGASARPADAPASALDAETAAKVNYGCGETILPGWLNVDLYESPRPEYRRVDLLEKHPFPSGSVRFAFAEDFLEHLTQAESIFFLGELYRTLAPSAVARLSFPGLEGVLAKHYTPPSETRLRQGEFEAYAFWDHVHFYALEELRLVALHLGFREVKSVAYGESEHPELRGLDTRAHQIGLNTCVELTK
jgi:predicted SAM-dependent methyltransferase